MKKFLVAIIVIYGVVSVWMIGSPYIKNAMFANDLDNIARILSVEGTVEGAKRKITEAAQYHGIPASPKDYTVIKDENTRQVIITVRYTVTVRIPFGLYTHVWNFAPTVQKGLQHVPRPQV